jgi:hypothetical protein
MARRLTTPERNVAAEARAVEEGHHSYVMPGGWVKVVSDSIEGKWYEVLFIGHIDDLISFTCRPHGRRCYQEDHLYATSGRPGELPCKHAALAARKLEREGLARLDDHGRWAATSKARRIRKKVTLPKNPLEGLPR